MFRICYTDATFLTKDIKRMNKALSMIIGLIIITSVAGVVFYQSKSFSQYKDGYEQVSGEGIEHELDDDADDATALPGVESATQADTIQSYTMADVGQHKDASSCWSAIDREVYDLTGWISKHPGGERGILALCGKDGTAMFRGQHGTAQKQQNILDGMKIGTLAS